MVCGGKDTALVDKKQYSGYIFGIDAAFFRYLCAMKSISTLSPGAIPADAAPVLAALRRGDWVMAGAKDSPSISMLLGRCSQACHRLNSMPPSALAPREQALRSILGRCGSAPVVHSPFRCDFGFNISVGDNFMANFGLSILDEAEVSIGDNVMIGPNCSLITIEHALDPGQRRRGVMRAKPISIGSDAWLAASVTVLPGVTIGEGSVIGAGSLVVSDIPPRTLAYGSPCRPVRPITSADRVSPA